LEDDIKMHLVGWESVDWIQLSQDRDKRWAVTNIVMHLRVP